VCKQLIPYFYSFPVRESHPFHPILSNLNPDPHTHTNFLKIHCSIVLHPTSRYPTWPLAFRLPGQNNVFIFIFPNVIRVSPISHNLDLITLTLLGKQFIEFSYVIFSVLLLRPPKIINILSSALSSETISISVLPLM
jgi:hypothetical protein